MHKRIILALFFLVVSYSNYAATKYASPDGSASNSGNEEMNAWSLEYALGNSSPLAPGDSLILVDGIYEGNFESFLNGAEGNPIIVIAQNDGEAIIDVSKNRTTGKGITVQGSHTWFVGLKVTSSSTERKSDASNGFSEIVFETGLNVFGDNIKIINCWIYDVLGDGVELWRSGLNNEVYGSIIFNNGHQGETRGNGHGFYIQHADSDQPKIIENNIVFQNASQGINLYTTNPENKGVKVIRNVSFNTGVMATVNLFIFRPPHNFTVGSLNNLSSDVEIRDNIFYRDLQGSRLKPTEVSNVTLGRTYSPNKNLSFTNNLVFGGGNQIEIQPVEGLKLELNHIYNAHGNFYRFGNSSDIFGNKSFFPNAEWDRNQLFNIGDFPTPFNGLTFEAWKNEFQFDLDSEYKTIPSSQQDVLITKNKYDPSKFYVTILSLNAAESVNVDFSEFTEFEGNDFEIIDFQNPFDTNQRVKGIFNGSSIQFPMNWNKSLQPKGNMPFPVVHTDRTFGTFMVKFKTSESFDNPILKETVKLYLDQEGKTQVKLADLVESFGSFSPEEFTLSKTEFDCLDIPETTIEVKAKKQSGEQEWFEIKGVSVLDTISPTFSLSDASVDFDLVKGEVAVSPDNFDIQGPEDNCSTTFEIGLSKSVFTCADLDEENGPFSIPVTLTVSDLSGNKKVEQAEVIFNVSESVKVSLSEVIPLFPGEFAEIKLGEELGFTVLEWYRNGQLVPGLKGNSIAIEEEGSYEAKILLESGCITRSQALTVELQDLDFPVVKSELTLELDAEGTATLRDEDLFSTWPLEDGSISIAISKSSFNCEDLGVNLVTVTLTNSADIDSEQEIEVLVKDTTPPVLLTKNIELTLDLTVGEGSFTADDLISTVSDNCGIEDITLSKTSVTCTDVGKVIEVEVRAVDASGNVTEKVAEVTVKSSNPSPVTIVGDEVVCEGSSIELTVVSEAAFEVVEWRREGEKIEAETGKTIEIEQGGSYQALVRYEGACLTETENFEVDAVALPSGEIEIDGKKLRAPEATGYQWYKNGDEIAEATGRDYVVKSPGEYTVVLSNGIGCTVTLDGVVFTADDFDLPYPPVRDRVVKELDNSGKSNIEPSDVFTSWPLDDTDLSVTLSKSELDCGDLGASEVLVIIKDSKGNEWEEKTELVVQDKIAPELITKNIELTLDLTVGEGSFTADDLISSISDNCGIEDITLSKTSVTCTDVGKVIEVEVRAVDASGNVTEKVAEVTVKSSNPSPVTIVGDEVVCEGSSIELTVVSEAAFEVVEWRREGEKIEAETGKTIEIEQGGSYQALVRYEGACLTETENFEVDAVELPSGEIEEEGSTLVAPEGNYTYQWFIDGEAISGSTERIINLDEIGLYTVELTNSAGCKSVLPGIEVTISGLVRPNLVLSEELKISPNPARSQVEVEVVTDQTLDASTILFYSFEGKDVSSKIGIISSGRSKFRFDISSLSAGAYLIFIQGENRKVFIGRLIKE